MAFVVSPDADPDPTTQMAWPGARGKRTSVDANSSTLDGTTEADDERAEAERGAARQSRMERAGKKKMSVLDLFNLSVSMAGAQIAWTVELGCVL
jgi:solute carrier family 45 protein 1/2/4